MTELKFLDLHGDRLAYRDEGGGDEVLLLIHGMAGSSETWRAVIPTKRESRASVAAVSSKPLVFGKKWLAICSGSPYRSET